MYTFPKTLKALREVMREETDDHSASDSAQWALGDAILEETECDPIWDRDDPPYCTSKFKGGLKLREAVDWLVDEQGIDESKQSLEVLLLLHRDVSESFPPERRSMRATYAFHIVCGDPEELDRALKTLPPGLIYTFMSEDSEAHAIYGPA
jgi:hypothetical protein